MVSMSSRALPDRLVAEVEKSGYGEWLEALPTLIDKIETSWSLEVGEPFQPGGQTAWVAPVRDANRTELVLKVVRRHWEAENEPEGLHEWDGNGAIQLHRSERFDGSVAMLLERCAPGTPLSTRPETDQDIVIAVLLRRLWIEPVSDCFRPLKFMCDRWADGFERKLASGRVRIDDGLAREGIALFRALPESAVLKVLLCTDLHAENVLAAEREPWLVIDPKPFVGDPSYDVLQHLLNCPERLRSDPGGLVQRMADLVGLDADRILLWLFARCVQESPERPELVEVARDIAPA